RTGPRKDFVELARTHPIRHIVKPCHQLGTINREQLEQTAAESDALSTQTWRVLLLIGLGGPIGGLIAGYGIARGLARSLTRLSVGLRGVAQRLDASGVRDQESGVRGQGSAPTSLTPDPCLLTPGPGLIQLTVAADGNLAALDRQLEHLLRRVE